MNAAKDPARGDLLFLLVASFLFCVGGIWMGSLASWDEAYYAIVSRDIYRSGDWVRLTYAGGSFFDKPPLYFWLTAAGYHLFGVGEWATRLPSALFGVGTVLVTYLLGARLIGREAALCGAGILLSSTDFLHYARWGTLDITHLFFFTAAILFYLRAREDRVAWIGFWIASALAVMTKGPLIILAWMLVLSHALFTRSFAAFRSRWFIAGLPLFGLIVLPWHLAAYRSDPEMFMKDFIFKHYVSRTQGALEGHQGGYYFYIRTLINKYHPWIILSFPALAWAMRKSIKDSDKGYLFLLFWVVSIFSFFTFLVATKLQWYILPLHPALSLVTGGFLCRMLPQPRRIHAVRAVTVATLLFHIPFSSSLLHDYTPAIKALAPRIASSVPQTETIYLYEFHDQPAASFYWDRPIAYIDSAAEFEERLRSGHRLFLLLRTDRHPDMERMLGLRGFKERFRSAAFDPNLALYSNG